MLPVIHSFPLAAPGYPATAINIVNTSPQVLSYRDACLSHKQLLSFPQVLRQPVNSSCMNNIFPLHANLNPLLSPGPETASELGLHANLYCNPLLFPGPEPTSELYCMTICNPFLSLRYKPSSKCYTTPEYTPLRLLVKSCYPRQAL